MVNVTWTRFARAIGAPLVAMLCVLAVGATPAYAYWTNTCDDWQSLFYGKYQTINNKWGHTVNNWGTGWQCVGRDTDNTTNGWQADLSWSNSSSEQWDEYHIKAFPSTVVGWQWGYANPDRGGLPVHLWENKNVWTNWSFQNQVGDQKSDAIYDLWLDWSDNPSSQPTDEVMIFLDYTAGAHPESNKVATVDLAGATWDVYRSTDSWQVISFVRTATTTSASMNLRDFLGYAVDAGWLDPNKYLISVQAGFEVWRGAGKYITTDYNVSVS
ncbi:GH12 family glycosyl hydrolase domain-containing protein [Micromonospora sp. 067-2]|uniref:GH12 family glycosyl hydrolase domain-containing protein n=1 Tax=Micromonospora sp. 067-2 TaxID=2789270 RepID=UPI00397A00C1